MTNIPGRISLTENFENALIARIDLEKLSSQKSISCTLYVLSALGVQ